MGNLIVVYDFFQAAFKLSLLHGNVQFMLRIYFKI